MFLTTSRTPTSTAARPAPRWSWSQSARVSRLRNGIYTDERNHTNELASWYNPPDGLQWVLNDRGPAGFGGWFALYSLATEDAISRKLCWTIHHYGVAAIAMV